MHHMFIVLTLSSVNVNAPQVWYPNLRPEEKLVLEPVIRACFADADQRLTAFEVMETLYAFIRSQNWV